MTCQRHAGLVEDPARLRWSLQLGRGPSARTAPLQEAGSAAVEKPLGLKRRTFKKKQKPM